MTQCEKRASTPFLPPDTTLPFFSYGIFRPGELAYFRVREFVMNKSTARVQGRMLVRDGLLIADSNGGGEIPGVVLTFRGDQSQNAYLAISEMEPVNQYKWGQVSVESAPVNILWGKRPSKGSDHLEEQWSSWKDPLFTDALDVVRETLQANWETEIGGYKSTFRVHMAFLLLWSSIERYASLKYNLSGNQAYKKVQKIAEEGAFANSLRELGIDGRSIFRADSPDTRAELDPRNPSKSMAYYYQVRSNIVHRGKAMLTDHRIVRDSCGELLQIFGAVLAQAKAEADADAMPEIVANHPH